MESKKIILKFLATNEREVSQKTIDYYTIGHFVFGYFGLLLIMGISLLVDLTWVESGVFVKETLIL